jgi:hypothetical protein
VLTARLVFFRELEFWLSFRHRYLRDRLSAWRLVAPRRGAQEPVYRSAY